MRGEDVPWIPRCIRRGKYTSKEENTRSKFFLLLPRGNRKKLSAISGLFSIIHKSLGAKNLLRFTLHFMGEKVLKTLKAPIFSKRQNLFSVSLKIWLKYFISANYLQNILGSTIFTLVVCGKKELKLIIPSGVGSNNVRDDRYLYSSLMTILLISDG